MGLIGAAIAIAGAAIGAAFGSSKVIAKTIESIARQPEMKNELQTLIYFLDHYKKEEPEQEVE